MRNGFFDYKFNIEGYHGQDMFGQAHIIFMLFAFALMILLCVLCRKTSHRRVDIYLKVLSIVIPVLEAVKIIWESYYDIAVFGGSFNWSGLLPAYTCSLFIYTLPLAAWTKGKVRECALSFLTTLGIFAGLTNFIYLNILNSYPLYSYATFTSINFHFLMVFTGFFLISTGYYRPSWRSVGMSQLVFTVFALLVSVINYAGNYITKSEAFDYCFLYSGSSCPVVCRDICRLLGPSLRPLYTLICIAGYILPTLIVFALVKIPSVFAAISAARAKKLGQRL